MSIHRYLNKGYLDDFRHDDTGEWVKYSDHQAELQRIRVEMQALVNVWRKGFPPRPDYVSAVMTEEERANNDGIAAMLTSQKNICASELETIIGSMK